MSDADLVYRFVAGKVKALSSTESRQTASLAKLRRGVGKPPGASPDVWELTLAELPEELAGYQGEPSRAEWAIHLALTLFALHQQGKNSSVNAEGVSFGQAVSRSAGPDQKNESGIKSRFNATLTAQGIGELAHHVRGLIQLMKANEVRMDYPLFAKDIFEYQFKERQDKVRLRWGEAYYRINTTPEPEPQAEAQTEVQTEVQTKGE
jgi:CRISPR system Cascade subunit CasB